MNPIIEKFMYALIPLLLSAVTYLWSTVHSTKELLAQTRIESELAREKLRHDVLTYATGNRERIVLLEEKIRRLEQK